MEIIDLHDNNVLFYIPLPEILYVNPIDFKVYVPKGHR